MKKTYSRKTQDIGAAFQNQILALHELRARYHLAEILQMKVLNMVPHVRNTFEGTSPLILRIPLVPDAGYTLFYAQHKGNSSSWARRSRVKATDSFLIGSL